MPLGGLNIFFHSLFHGSRLSQAYDREGMTLAVPQSPPIVLLPSKRQIIGRLLAELSRQLIDSALQLDDPLFPPNRQSIELFQLLGLLL